MSGALDLGSPGVECTFVAGPLVRDGYLALWRRTADHLGSVGPFGAAEPHDADHGHIDLLLLESGTVRRRRVPVRRLTLGDAIDPLVTLGPEGRATPSTHAWAHATRSTLHLLARGRLLPSADADGTDTWRSGPLDADDLIHWHDLATALPFEAHATEIPGSAPRRVASPTWLLARFRDSVTDAYVRTAAAPEAAGHRPFAARARSIVAGSTSWLVDAGAVGDSPVTVALRVEPGDEALRAVVQVTSRLDPSLVLDAADLWAAPPTIRARFGARVDDAVILTLRRAARAWPPAARLLEDSRPTDLALTDDEVDDLLGPTAEELAGSGLEVLWPSGLLSTVRVTPTVSTRSTPSDRPAGLGLDGICELRWSTTVDGVELGDTEVAALVAAKRQIVRMRGRWVRADPARLEKLRTRRSVSTAAALAAALGGDLLVDGEAIEAVVEGPLAGLAETLRASEARPDVEVPRALEAVLRPYQRTGLSWLATMADLGLGGVLADDMGLGKTVQLLALHLHRIENGRTPVEHAAFVEPAPNGPSGNGPTLIVCPVSVIANWERETKRFAPSVPVRRYHGTSRDLHGVPAGSIVLTTYGVARRAAETLSTIDWGLVVADEAQNVKNPSSRTARALRTIPASARFALTGTPVENRLVDLWALLDWTTPGLLGPLERFRHEIAVPIERDGDEQAASALARLVRPFVLRRRKVDPEIAPDLPPKTESDHVVGLTTEQATLYRAMVDEVMSEIEGAEGMARRGLVLKLLSGLKQICNHPAHFLGQSGPLRGRSAKLDALTEIVETATEEGDSVLVFTQYVRMGRLLAEHLSTTVGAVDFFHGGMTAAERQALVDRFQAGELPVLVVSLKAGGTGLNLTRATHVVHYDRWWNPAVEDQASDRAWRIGQDRPVQVHRMVCEGTVEDRIAQLIDAKRELAEAVVGSGEGWIGDLDDDDLRELVSLGTGPTP